MAISFCSGDGASVVVWVRWAILPNAVCMPVANTSAFASPVVTEVPASRTFRLRSRSVLVADGRASRDTGPRFARDRGVVHAHAECLEQPAVGRHVVAGAQEDHVAGDDVFGRDDDHARHAAPDLVWQQALQRGHRLFGPVFLPEREGAVDDNHRHDRDRERRHSLTGHPRSAINARRAATHRSAAKKCVN